MFYRMIEIKIEGINVVKHGKYKPNNLLSKCKNTSVLQVFSFPISDLSLMGSIFWNNFGNSFSFNFLFNYG